MHSSKDKFNELYHCFSFKGKPPQSGGRGGEGRICMRMLQVQFPRLLGFSAEVTNSNSTCFLEPTGSFLEVERVIRMMYLKRYFL